MANESLNDKIKLALGQLDHANPEHWTDDGLPRTGVVQKLANDPTIKRVDINNASPGFTRNDGKTSADTAKASATTSAEGSGGASAENADGGTTLGDVEMSEDEVKQVLDGRINECQADLDNARQMIADGRKLETDSIKALAAARRDRASRFPPMTVTQNIKQYLNAEGERRALAAGALPARIDQAAQQGNSRGWKRPTRPAIGTDGVLVQPAGRQSRQFLPSQGTKTAA